MFAHFLLLPVAIKDVSLSFSWESTEKQAQSELKIIRNYDGPIDPSNEEVVGQV